MNFYQTDWELNKICATGGDSEVPEVVLKPEKGKAGIVIFSDVHIGQFAFNQKLFENFLDLVEKNNYYVMLGGDLMEYAIPVHMPQTMFGQQFGVDAQIKLVRKYFMPLKDRIIFATNGNHEDRQWKRTGNDVMAMLARDFGCYYSKAGGCIKLKVGKQEYMFAVFHGHSNAQSNIWLELERRWNFYPEVDLVAMGHVHHLAHKSIPKFEVSKGSITRRYVHFVRTGSYLTNADYAMTVGYPPTLDGSPIVTLDATKKSISVDCRGETLF